MPPPLREVLKEQGEGCIKNIPKQSHMALCVYQRGDDVVAVQLFYMWEGYLTAFLNFDLDFFEMKFKIL